MIYLISSDGHYLNTLEEQREMARYLLRLGLYRSCGLSLGENSIERNRLGQTVYSRGGWYSFQYQPLHRRGRPVHFKQTNRDRYGKGQSV